MTILESSPFKLSHHHFSSLTTNSNLTCSIHSNAQPSQLLFNHYAYVGLPAVGVSLAAILMHSNPFSMKIIPDPQTLPHPSPNHQLHLFNHPIPLWTIMLIPTFPNSSFTKRRGSEEAYTTPHVPLAQQRSPPVAWALDWKTHVGMCKCSVCKGECWYVTWDLPHWAFF